MSQDTSANTVETIGHGAPPASASLQWAEHYSDLKRWGASVAFTHNKSQSLYLAGEVGTWARPGAHCLEIGFGQGCFLSWARAQGMKVTGCELLTDMVNLGAQRGFDVRLGTAEQAIDPATERFDLIVAFDVLEHVPFGTLPGLLRHLADCLSPDGRIVLRFPNGESPLGRLYQYGDITHCTVLSAAAMRQLARLNGLRVVSARNQYRATSAGCVGLIKRRFLQLGQALFEQGLARLYGFSRVPMAPNVVVVLARTPLSPADEQ